jgi:hypothetical protein
MRRLDAAGLLGPSVIAVGLADRPAAGRAADAPDFADFVLALHDGRSLPVYRVHAAGPAPDAPEAAVPAEAADAYRAAAAAFRLAGAALVAGPKRPDSPEKLGRVG